jgi:glycosyltransferase involved in cell wall biosynthesis
MGFVCAFRGRRDSYQVPIALAEAGQLDCFITDYFSGDIELAVRRLLPQLVGEKLLSRHDALIPAGKVHRLLAYSVMENLALRMGVSPARIYARFDPLYGRATARLARQNRSDILAYSSYAWDAFRATYTHRPRKILFQYHPHFALENAILTEDLSVSAKLGVTFTGSTESGAVEPDSSRIKGDSAWKLADHTLCASTFTKRSLVDAGADPATISVIPYGIDMPETPPKDAQPAGGEFHALFVGSGLQRKGLHHLLLAWRKSELPAGARLTVVSRVIDPGLVTLLSGAQGIEFRAGVTASELAYLYSKATLFAMPSLVEGFGQVYLEALAHGLPVLGTVNSCLPDLGGESDGIFLTPPGNSDTLSSSLGRLSSFLPRTPEIRDKARECAARFTWSRFRAELIRQAVSTDG